MHITSPAFKNNTKIPQQYTCLGENYNPPLEFTNIPKNAKSLLLIVEDKDAPNHWIHWLVFNIPPTTTIVNQHEIPKGGTEGLANNNTFGYEGPCPKYFTGTHHYLFTLYALDSILNILKESDKQKVEDEMRGHVIENGTLIGICNSKQNTLYV